MKSTERLTDIWLLTDICFLGLIYTSEKITRCKIFWHYDEWIFAPSQRWLWDIMYFLAPAMPIVPSTLQGWISSTITPGKGKDFVPRDQSFILSWTSGYFCISMLFVSLAIHHFWLFNVIFTHSTPHMSFWIANPKTWKVERQNKKLFIGQNLTRQTCGTKLLISHSVYLCLDCRVFQSICFHYPSPSPHTWSIIVPTTTGLDLFPCWDALRFIKTWSEQPNIGQVRLD